MPSQLEIIGPECFVNFKRASSYTGNLPGIKLPDTLRSIYAGTYSSYSTFGNCDNSFFTEDSLPLPDLEKLATQAAINIAGYFQSSMTSLSYLPTKTNPQAYYLGTSESPAILVIPEGCKGIFNIPSHVTSISIPESVTMMGPISSRDQLTSITFNNNRTSMTELPTEFLYSCSSVTSFSIPEGITKLSKNCFQYCSALTSISIPEGVTYIPEYFTSSCSALTTVNFPEGITKIDSYSFQNCPISYITLPSTLTQVGYSVFQEPSSVTSKTIEIKAKTPPSLSSSTSLASTSSKITKIIVPQGCLNKYKTAYNWKNYASVMEESTEW